MLLLCSCNCHPVMQYSLTLNISRLFVSKNRMSQKAHHLDSIVVSVFIVILVDFQRLKNLRQAYLHILRTQL